MVRAAHMDFFYVTLSHKYFLVSQKNLPLVILLVRSSYALQ